MDLTPDPEVVRAAALGCLFAAFMAEQLGYVVMATELLTAAAILREFAEMLVRKAAARKPAPQNIIIQLSVNIEAISSMFIAGPDVMRRLASGAYPVSPGPRV